MRHHSGNFKRTLILLFKHVVGLLGLMSSGAAANPLSLALLDLERSLNLPERNRSATENYQLPSTKSDRNLLRTEALVIAILLIVFLIICICAMYWLACWTSTCTGVTVMRTMIQGRWRVARRSYNLKSKATCRYSDQPPSYDLVLEEAEETPPPSYKEAVRKKVGPI